MNRNEIADTIKKLIYKGIKLDSTRSGEFAPEIHASSLYNGCPRRFVLAYRMGILLNGRIQKLSNSQKVTYRIGQKIEEMVIEALRPYLIGQIKTYGNIWIYRSPLLRYKIGEFEILGHPDIVVAIDGVKFIIEVKSIDKDEFDTLNEHIYKHEHQTLAYVYLAKKSRMGFSDVAFIVYIAKGHKQDPIKVFPVKLTKSYREQLEVFSKSVKKSKVEGIPKRICTTKLHPLARGCPIRNICWGEEQIKGGNYDNKSRTENSKKDHRESKNEDT
jgi:CRISPR/Cas system-associated exonuclease Cas4 (RecB family)